MLKWDMEHFQGKTCISGTVFLYLKTKKQAEGLSEFDIVLNPALEVTYEDKFLESFSTSVRKASDRFLEQSGMERRYLKTHFENSEDAKAWIKASLMEAPVFLFVHANGLTYDPAFKHSNEAVHVIGLYGHDDGKYYVADSYITNAPLTSFYGWVDEDEIIDAWRVQGGDCFVFAGTKPNVQTIVENRLGTLALFFERYLKEEAHDNHYYGIQAKKKLLMDVKCKLGCSDEDEQEQIMFVLNYHFRANAILGLMQIIQDCFWTLSVDGNAFWKQCSEEMEALIGKWIKEMRTLVKMSLRKRTDAMQESIQSMIDITSEEEALYGRVMNHLLSDCS